jgi:ABC-type dipeptide/oligopeptide/nickel transport system permease subunit
VSVSGRLVLTASPAAPVVASYWRLVGRRLARDPTTLIAGALLGGIVLAAVLAPALAPYDPAAGSIRSRLSPIGTAAHPLGTDEQGRDMLSRLLFGGRMTLLAGLTPIVIACLFGGVLGVLAGYLGGVANALIMRTSDVFYAFPAILLAIAISGALGPGLGNTLISLSVVFLPRIIRVAEAVTVQTKSLEYVAAARASGAGPWPIVRYHLLPNVLEHPSVALDHPRRGPVVPRSRRDAARRGVGIDAEHAAAIDLRRRLGAGAARRRHLRRVDGVQSALRRSARRDGRSRLTCPRS